MARISRGYLCLFSLAACAATLLLGCASQNAGIFKPLCSILQMKEPIRIGVTRVQINPVQVPWDGLRADLKKKLGRDLQFVCYQPFQMRTQLEKGYLDLAILSATEYAQIGRNQTCTLLAKPINTLGLTSRHGLIITRKNSKLQTLADLKFQRFAFGPAGSATTDLAAAYAFMKAGLEPADIPRELLPIPMTRRHHMNSFEVAKAVAYEPLMEAGVVDSVAWATWPEKNRSPTLACTPIPLVLQSVTRDLFRVIAETATLPEGPIVASKKADPALVAAVTKYLLSDAIPDKALTPMEWQGFVAVEDGEYDQAAQMVLELQWAGWRKESGAGASFPATAAASQPPAQVDTTNDSVHQDCTGK